MAAKESQESYLEVDEAQTTGSSRKQGGWITFPFISGSLMGMSLAVFGATSNIIVFLIKQFNVKSIDAAQISNIINGCISLAPIAGAIISDSYFGCFPVVAVSSFVSLLSMILFTLTATLRSLRPAPCPIGSITCDAPSTGQYGVLYAAVALMSVGTGGTRFNTATMGANQFDNARDQDSFFNWYFVVMYVSAIMGSTVIVYVQDVVSWGWGFGLCAIANAVSLVALLSGTRYYRRPKPEGSPFTGLARVVVATVRKWKVAVSTDEAMDCYYHGPGERKLQSRCPTESFRFLNRAALKREGDTHLDGSVAKPWSLCTVEQVEDLKTIIRILPLWSTAIFISISIGVQMSLTVLQALTVNRRLGPHFSVPAGSVVVSSLAATAVSLSFLDRCLYPAWRKMTGRSLTPLQRVGLGHAINAMGMAASALVERRRLGIVRSHRLADESGSAVVPMSVLWLMPPFMLVGLGEAFHFPGQVALYYQEFPKSLRSSATGMIALLIALGFYLSTAVVDLVRGVTDWLPDDINASKLDRVYWMLAVIGTLNFGGYILCSRLYKYQSTVVEKDAGGEVSRSPT